MDKAPSSPLYSWWTLKKVKEELKELNQIPLFGQSGAFNWEESSSILGKQLESPNLSIEPTSFQWRSSGELGDGLGGDITVFPIVLSPLNHSVYWMMSQENIKKLTSLLLHREEEGASFLSPLVQEGFYRYCLLEILDAISHMEPLETLTFMLQEKSSIPEESAFCIDISLHDKGQTCSGRLAIPNSFRSSWISYFSNQTIAALSPRFLQSLELILGIKVGSVILELSQWEKVKKGDFIFLDQGSYDPRHFEGIASLTLGATPLFHVSLEKNKIHLLNFAFIYEDATDMPSQEIPEDEPMKDNTPTLTPQEEAESVGIRETPVYITVELAKIRMTLGELMQLSPGNDLNLPLELDQEVSLSVNGKKIGKGSLVYLGEQLGVRITRLG